MDNDFAFPLFITVTTFLFPTLLVFPMYAFMVRRKDRPGKTIIQNKIKKIMQEKPPFILPKSIRIIQKNLNMIEKKMVLIRSKINKIGGYINMLNIDKKDDKTNNIISKQKEYYEYIGKYYDDYCSLYLETRFQFYMALIKDILIAKSKIHDITISRFIEIINNDMEFTKHTLIYDKDFDRYFISIGDIDAVKFFIQFSIESEKEEFGDNNQFPNLNKSMEAIKKLIPNVTAYLITVQSHKIIGDTSPIDEENILNIYKQENGLEMIFEHSKKLDEEYDRFAAEIELSEKR
jgi:hypothetical protein